MLSFINAEYWHAECHLCWVLLCWASFMVIVVMMNVIYAECCNAYAVMLNVIYTKCCFVDCDLCWVLLCWMSYILSVINAESHLCSALLRWISFMLSVVMLMQLCWMWFILSAVMLNVIYSEYCNAECCYAECCGTFVLTSCHQCKTFFSLSLTLRSNCLECLNSVCISILV